MNRKICYSDCHISSAWTPIDFGLFNDLRNIPIPFHAGDIVTLDCRPFAPVSHTVILKIGDNRDCCCLQSLYREDNGTWDTEAVKQEFEPNEIVSRQELLWDVIKSPETPENTGI